MKKSLIYYLLNILKPIAAAAAADRLNVIICSDNATRILRPYNSTSATFLHFVNVIFSEFLNSLLKIWNLNKLTGVVGVFNCQGAGTWPMKQALESTPASKPISGCVSPLDVEFLDEIVEKSWNGEYAVFGLNSGYFRPTISFS